MATAVMVQLGAKGWFPVHRRPPPGRYNSPESIFFGLCYYAVLSGVLPLPLSRCAVPCHAVLCCAALCCAVLCWPTCTAWHLPCFLLRLSLCCTWLDCTVMGCIELAYVAVCPFKPVNPITLSRSCVNICLRYYHIVNQIWGVMLLQDTLSSWRTHSATASPAASPGTSPMDVKHLGADKDSSKSQSAASTPSSH